MADLATRIVRVVSIRGKVVDPYHFSRDCSVRAANALPLARMPGDRETERYAEFPKLQGNRKTTEKQPKNQSENIHVRTSVAEFTKDGISCKEYSVFSIRLSENVRIRLRALDERNSNCTADTQFFPWNHCSPFFARISRIPGTGRGWAEQRERIGIASPPVDVLCVSGRSRSQGEQSGARQLA